MSIESYQREAAMNVINSLTFSRDDIISALYRAGVPVSDVQDEADAMLADFEQKKQIIRREELGENVWQKL